MDIRDLMEMQATFDRRHGFPVDFDSDARKYEQISKDLIGLFGEVGEFSNIVKKINIHLQRPSVYELSISVAEDSLREELTDSFIYMIRLALILGVDIEAEYLRKMDINAARYERLK